MSATLGYVVFVTVPAGDGKNDVGDRIAQKVVEERLAACVNRISGISSTYRWQGKVEKDTEDLLVIKTMPEKFSRLRDRVVELHPYDVPEVIALPIERGHHPYLKWIQTSCMKAM